MKITTAVSTILAGMACAASAASVGSLPRSDPSRTYKLRIVAPSASGINGKFLSIQPGGEVGIYSPNGVVQPKAGHGLVPPLAPSPDNSDDYGVGVPAPAQFSIATSKSHHYELHTYPIGIVDHALALNGTGGLLFLRDVANPAGAASGGPAGYKLDWQSFTLGGFGGDEGDASDLAAQVPLANGLSYAGSNGRWVLIQKGAGSYAAAWYDGTSIITQNYRPVDIAYVEA